MPINLQEDFKLFEKDPTFKNYVDYQILLHYSIKNRISWIFCWNFDKVIYQEIDIFTRQFKIKWWDLVKKIKYPMQREIPKPEQTKIKNFLLPKLDFNELWKSIPVKKISRKN